MRKLSTLLLFLLCMTTAQARHLLGGYLSYECLGDGDYEITMRLYRDCACTNCADFDRPAEIAIYNCDWESCASFNQADVLHSLQIPISTVTNIGIPDEYCAATSGLCIQEGLYQFKLSDYGINLPASDQDYHIVYQRCCRSEVVTNIVDPTSTGMTLFSTISPMAYQNCNNSVSLDVPPMFSACVTDAFNYEIPIQDPDGDSLAIGFCAPFNGGGPNLAPDAYTRCMGAQPTPPCPPPYNNVSFVNGFDPGTPINLELEISLDSNIARIIGSLEELGKFSIGLCIQEFSNGLLVNTTPIEFETQVAFAAASSNNNVFGREEIKIYPNPNNDRLLWVEREGTPNDAVVEIFAVNGKLLLQQTISGSKTSLDLKALSKGIYSLRIFNGTRITSKKLVIQ